MIEQDTIKLLRECDSGVHMGVSSIRDVLENVRNSALHKLLSDSMDDHETLGRQIEKLLHDYDDEGKTPPAIVKGMSWIKTNVKLALGEEDKTVADLMTDGCDMGVKSLSKYLNKYKAADEKSKDCAKKLIAMEEHLAQSLRPFL